MAINSPGSYAAQISPKPTTPKSPRHFVFPQKSPSVVSSGSSGYYTPQSSGSYDKSPSAHCKPPKSPKLINLRSPKSPRKFNFIQEHCDTSASESVSNSEKSYQTLININSSSSFCKSPSSLKGYKSVGTPPVHIHTNPGYVSPVQGTVTYDSNIILSKHSPYSSNNNLTNSDCGRHRDSDKESGRSITRCRKSTSDLTDDTDDTEVTRYTNISRPTSPMRRGSMKGGLAYLASRRGSRDSVVSNCSKEDIGPLNFQNTARGRQRRTSNFLELPEFAKLHISDMIPKVLHPILEKNLDVSLLNTFPVKYNLKLTSPNTPTALWTRLRMMVQFAAHIRPRVCSLPEQTINPRASDDLYRLRTFSITKGGVINEGDSIISRRSRSNTSVNTTASRASDRSPFDGSCCSGYQQVDSSSPTSPDADELPPFPKYRVVLLGDIGVGKTALVSQFMTSEYMNTYDASLDDEFGEKSVSVLLDGEESELVFIDHPSVEMSVENSLSTYDPHACVVVYSITSRSSFNHASEILNYLWKQNYTKEKSIIVVGNKADLARSRVITANEGKALATSRDCKFIETSSGIQHNVDELLVGVLKQVRLRNAPEGSSGRAKTPTGPRALLQRFCRGDHSKARSCENLHVL